MFEWSVYVSEWAREQARLPASEWASQFFWFILWNRILYTGMCACACVYEYWIQFIHVYSYYVRLRMRTNDEFLIGSHIYSHWNVIAWPYCFWRCACECVCGVFARELVMSNKFCWTTTNVRSIILNSEFIHVVSFFFS